MVTWTSLVSPHQPHRHGQISTEGLRVGLKEAHGNGGAVMALQNWGSLLLTAAARDGLHGWDLRTHTKAFSLAGTPHLVRPSTAAYGRCRTGLQALASPTNLTAHGGASATLRSVESK